ncbi:MAG: alpha/beta hydrolase [Saccharospirillum sp.]|nr:alpha/beta hydrolase [Saccharospirillum sp.]
MQAQLRQLANGWQSWQEQGEGPAIVLLHGISSCAASWSALADQLSGYRLLAWDAPGYGESSPLLAQQPNAGDYADRLEAWLAELNVERCVLVGHSLGALMASAYQARYPQRLRGLVLADPAQGYRHDTEQVREQVFHSRWPLLVKLGAEAFADERAPRLLKANPSESALAQVKAAMRQLHVDGFRQANWMLANDDLVDWWQQGGQIPAEVVCGNEDAITPPESVQSLARRLQLRYHELPGAGHASYLDAPEAFAQELLRFVRSLPID